MHTPRLKLAHRPVRRPDGAIWIGSTQYGLGAELTGDDTGLLWEACQAMDGTRSTGEIVAALAEQFSVTSGIADRAVSFVIESGWAEDVGAAAPASLTGRDLERYKASADYLSWIDLQPRMSRYELQARLKSSRVTVIGVGGTGSAVAASLAGSGIGSLHCVDGDVVELSNLNRQLLYTESDIGKPKAEAMAGRLRSLNGDIKITASNTMLGGPEDIAREITGSDIFVHCADEPLDIIDWSNSAALRLIVPWVLSTYAGPMLAVATFIPGKTGCYRCALAEEKQRLDRLGRGDLFDIASIPDFNPVMAPTAQITGHLAALETIYYLLDMTVHTAGRQLHRNFLDHEHHYYLDAPARADCDACGPGTAFASG